MSGALALAEWDWVYTRTRGGRRLHHLADAGQVEDEVQFYGARTTCGLHADLCIPGLLSRMGMDCCAKCCDKLGIPRGVGSPKNDPELRPWVEARLATAPPDQRVRSSSASGGTEP